MGNKVANFVLYIIIGIALIAGLSFWSQPPYDPDLGWHLLGGSFVMREHRVPTFDFINSFSTRWHDYHWLAQIAMFGVFERGSYLGLSIALGVVSALFAVVLVVIAARRGYLRRSPLLSVSAILLTLTILAKVTSVRPQALSLLILSLALLRLSSPAKCGEVALLFIYAVIAANMHVYWLFVPVLYALYRVAPVWSSASSTRKERVAVLLGLCVLFCAALVSPYGIFYGKDGWIFENYALLYDYLIMPAALRDTIGELKSSFGAGGISPLLLTFAAAVFARGYKKSDLRSHQGDLLAALIGFLLATRATKFLAIFALFSFPYFLICLVRATKGLRTARLKPGAKYSMGILSTVLCATFVYSVRVFPSGDSVAKELGEELPIKACENIAALPLAPSNGRDHVRVLTPFNYGGWCRWVLFQRAPEKDLRVTTDGRTQWFPPDYFIKAIDLYNARFDWLETLRAWRPDVVLVPRDKPLANVLSLAPSDWKLEYSDSGFAVFTPLQK